MISSFITPKSQTWRFPITRTKLDSRTLKSRGFDHLYQTHLYKHTIHFQRATQTSTLWKSFSRESVLYLQHSAFPHSPACPYLAPQLTSLFQQGSHSLWKAAVHQSWDHSLHRDSLHGATLPAQEFHRHCPLDRDCSYRAGSRQIRLVRVSWSYTEQAALQAGLQTVSIPSWQLLFLWTRLTAPLPCRQPPCETLLCR